MDDFVCPVGFECPDDLMPEIEFWTKIYGEYDKTKILIYDKVYRNIYSVVDCGGDCENFVPTLHREHIINTLKSIISKKTQGSTSFSEDEIQILQRIPANFNFTGADRRVKYRHGLQDHIRSGMPSYKKYREYIVKTLDEQKVPLALQYLPFSESSYEALAVSPEVGAVGMWQFMKPTGQTFGLTINPVIDERRDPITATVAAAKLFKSYFTCFRSMPCVLNSKAHENVLGNFVLTSYVYGFGGTKKALNIYGPNYMTMRSKYNSIDKNYGDSSQNYTAKFYAVTHVVKHEYDYLGEFIEPKEKINTQTVLFERPTKTTPLIHDFSFDVEELKRFDPNLKYTDSVWNGKKLIPGDYELEVPYVERSRLEKYGKVSAERITLQKIEPRPIKIIPVSIDERKLATPSVVTFPSDARKTRRSFLRKK